MCGEGGFATGLEAEREIALACDFVLFDLENARSDLQIKS